MMLRLDLEQLAFLGACAINLVDLMGLTFTGPALVPYGYQLGASTTQIALFQTIRYAVGFISMIWMPRLADRRGVKFCCLISLIGSGVAYLIQGLAYRFDENGVTVMLIGCGVSGFFGGTMPVLRAFVTKLCLPDIPTLKFRLTVLFASAQAGNFVLAPISGLISRWGLHLPWYVSAGVAGVVWVFTLAFFQNADEIKRRKAEQLAKLLQARSLQSNEEEEEEEESSEAERQKPAPQQPEVLPAYEGPTPYQDKLLYLMTMGYFCSFCSASAIYILVPMLLGFDDYGLEPADIAGATSLAMVPNGIVNLICSTLLFLVVSSRIGDINTLRLGGLITCVVLPFYGYCTRQVWHVCICHGFLGAGVGFFVPAILPTLQQYGNAAHSKNVAQASGLPLFGMTGGMVIGPMLFSAIIGEEKIRWRMNLAFLVAAAIMATGIACWDIALSAMLRHPALTRLQKTPREVRLALETGAQNEEEFIDEAVELFRAMLTKGNPQCRNINTWHGMAQTFVRRLLNDTFPKLRDYNEETGGREYLEDIAAWISRVGNSEEQEYWRSTFPHIPLMMDGISAAHLGDARDLGGAFGLGEGLRRRAQTSASLRRQVDKPEIGDQTVRSH